MPDLPTITVTQAQADKILEAFGGTTAVAVPAYKLWLSQAVRQYVMQVKAEEQVAINNATTKAVLDTLSGALPDEPPPV